MNSSPDRKEKYFLEAGYICFSRKDQLLQAVTGSCVVVCLWDRELKCGGMNHFVYPFAKSRRKATPVYGNAAVAGLIKLMESAGCKKENLESHILGGAIPEGKKKHDIGGGNVRVARGILEKKGIKIVSEDVGGVKGRKIAFDIKSGQVMVMKVHRIRASDWRR